MTTARNVVLITGGTGRIGSVLTRHLCNEGWTVVCPVRGEQQIETLYAGLKASARRQLVGIHVDLSKHDAVQSIAALISQRGLQPTAMVHGARDRNSASFDAAGIPSSDTWINEYRLNVVLPFELSMALAMQETSCLRSVVVLASMYGVVAINPELNGNATNRWPIHYGCAKAAAIHMVKELAVRLAPIGVRANAISFGGVEGRVDEEFTRRYARLCPQGRMLNDDDLKGVVGFLISEQASGITGANVMVDGGWTAW